MISRQVSLLAAAVSMLILLVAASVLPAAAQSCEEGSPAAYIDLQENNQTYWCQLPFPVGLVNVAVVARAIPFQKIRFALSDPGLGLVLGDSWVGPATGDRINGIEVDMGGCVGPGEVLVGTLLILVTTTDTAPCMWWNVTGAEVQDCSGDWRPAVPVDHEVGTGYCGDCCFQCCYYALSLYDLYPPNGAANVPLDVVLSWDGTQNYYVDPMYGGCGVTIGTSPDCSSGTTFHVPCDLQEFAPDFLQPNTTYYWRASWGTPPDGCSDLNSGASPLYSFTTEGVSPVETKTWGYVKSIYR